MEQCDLQEIRDLIYQNKNCFNSCICLYASFISLQDIPFYEKQGRIELPF